MVLEANKAIVLRYYNELWNRWDLELADEIIDSEIVFRGSLGITVNGLAGFKQYVNTVRAAFPDFYNTIEELIAEENKVAALLTYRGTHQGKIFDVEATGRRITYSGIAIFYVSRGKLTKGWVMGDTQKLIRQIKNGP